MSYTKEELEEFVSDPRTQAMLGGLIVEAFKGIMGTGLISPETKEAVVKAINDEIVAPGSASGVTLDLEKLGVGAPPVPISKPKTIPTDAQVKEFNDLMKQIVDKNKGRKTLIGKDIIEKLVKVIDEYTGAVKIMQKIKSNMNKTGSETFDEKVEVVSEFIKSLTV